MATSSEQVLRSVNPLDYFFRDWIMLRYFLSPLHLNKFSLERKKNRGTFVLRLIFVGDTGLFHDPQTGPWYPIISRKSAARFPVCFIAPSLEQVQLGA
jgi:hypothetical protein